MTRVFDRIACLILLAALSSVPTARASASPIGLTNLQNGRWEIALNLSRPIAACVKREDNDYAAFHGCIDWHSAVHGAWALVEYEQLTHDRRYDQIVAAELTKANIAQEEKLIESNPAFEMPYGRSWFLRLAIDYGRLHDDGLLIHMGDVVAQSLYDRYRHRRAQPLSGAYDSDSWALINLMDYYVYRGDSVRLAAVKAVVRRDFAGPDVRRCDQNSERAEFMAICTNVAWAVSKAEDKPAFVSWLVKFFPPSAIQPPIDRPASDHENGLDFSRAWGLWAIYAATGDAAYANAYVTDFNAAYANTASWDGPYATVRHWVAQFGMFALRPAFGDGH